MYIVYVCVLCLCGADVINIYVCVFGFVWLVGWYGGEGRGGEGVDYDDTHKIYLYIYDNI